MTVPADLLRAHMAYDQWANRQLLDAAAELPAADLERDFGTADKSIVGTLAHVFGAERLWLGRFQGEANPRFLTDADRSLAVLQNDWPALAERWNLWMLGLTDEGVMAPLAYRDMKGNPWTEQLWRLILHVVNHGTHHRGQVSGFLRTLGHTPPVLDLSVYDRQQQAAQRI